MINLEHEGIELNCLVVIPKFYLSRYDALKAASQIAYKEWITVKIEFNGVPFFICPDQNVQHMINDSFDFVKQQELSAKKGTDFTQIDKSYQSGATDGQG